MTRRTQMPQSGPTSSRPKTRRSTGMPTGGTSSVQRGEIRWYTFASPDKKRPVLLLTRDAVIKWSMLPNFRQAEAPPDATSRHAWTRCNWLRASRRLHLTQTDIIAMKPLRFLGDSLKRLCEFSRDAKHDAGYQLDLVQRGKRPPTSSPCPPSAGASFMPSRRRHRPHRSRTSPSPRNASPN